jgi:pimeloyl-ACP methyl ester carboxylesterase
MPTAPGNLPWNGDLLIFAHGYVSPTEPVGIPEDQLKLSDDTSLPEAVNALGYAFATTSYSVNGLAIRQGVADLVDLVDIFVAAKGKPTRIYLVGASEGGLITTLAVEQHPDEFNGGLAMCGPYGDFAAQINYFGDFRTVFDYFFPGLMPNDTVTIPPSLLQNWDSHYQTVIKPAIEDPAKTSLVDQLLKVTSAPFDAAQASTKSDTIEDLLWYNVFSTNDGIQKLGGQPYDNQSRTYSGSNEDALLNQNIKRFKANPAALTEVATYYQTSGKLTVPLVTLHTTGDPVVPYWHVASYQSKTILADNIALHEHFKIERYGHCTFTAFEVIAAFNRLQAMVLNPPPYRPVIRLFLPVVIK